MKNYKLNKYFLLTCLVCMLLMQYHIAHAQVNKAMKYAWFFDYERAEKFLTNSKNEMNDTMVVELAEVLYQQGKYPQALYYYKLADKRGAIQTQQARRNYVFASTMMREKSPYYKKTNYFKNNYLLYTVIDTFAGNSNNAEISSFCWNDLLFVTTSRRTVSNEKAFNEVYTKMPYLDVYPFNDKGKQLRYPSYLPKTINTPVNDGPITISLDTNLIVLTRNYTKANARDVQNLYITYYLRDSKKKWSKALPFNFCKPGFSTQHPYYNEAEKYLYFSSDMPGGSGGFDLYKTKWNGTQWTPPLNLGSEINSEFDEVFPSFTPDGELVYASNHIETTGGLDIVLFSNNNRYLLNEPFNTIYDDFGMIFKSKKEGYFTSNRYNSKFDDNIYHFNLSEPEKQTLYVKTYDATSGVEIGQVKVNVENEDGSIKREVITIAGNDNIAIADSVDARTAIHFSVSKPGYLFYDVNNNEYLIKEGRLTREIFLQKSPIYAADDYFEVENNNRSSKFESVLNNDSLLGMLVQEKDVYIHILNNPLEGLLKMDNVDGKIKISSGAAPGKYNFNYAICSQVTPSLCDTGEVVIVVRSRVEEERTTTNADVIEDVDAPDIRVVNDTGFTTINGGYIMNVRNNDRVKGRKASQVNSVIRNERSDHPDIVLNSRTGVVTMKKGVPAGTYHLYYDINVRGNKSKMEKASVTVVVRNRDQIPAKGSMGDMQVRSDDQILYFHNDEPSAFQMFRSSFNYQNSYENYLKVKSQFYQKSADSKPSLDTFFTRHLEAGYDEVNDALELIQSKLNQGVQVEILVTAYCSPIASAAYNNKLSSRRLISVIRYLKKWNEGALSDAIESNRIIFWEHAVGELEAPKDISFDYNKLNESVYGIKASLERRVNLTVKIMDAR